MDKQDCIFSELECLRRIMFLRGCAYGICVCVVAREEAGGLCASLRLDRLVPETETRCEDPAVYCQNNGLVSRQLDFHSDHHMVCKRARGGRTIFIGRLCDPAWAQSAFGQHLLPSEDQCRAID